MGAARIPGWVDLGYEFLAVDSDATFLLAAAREALSDASGAPAGRHTWMRSRIEMIPITSPSRTTTR